MKTLFTAMTFFLLIFTKSAFACTCEELGTNFFETVSLHNSKVESGEYSEVMELTIVSADVVKYLQLRNSPYPTEMLLNVSGVIQGDLSSKSLIVEGDDGFSCSPYVMNFSIGKKYLLALGKYKGRYYISSCGHYSTSIETR